jgi:hypothetical protein
MVTRIEALLHELLAVSYQLSAIGLNQIMDSAWTSRHIANSQ